MIVYLLLGLAALVLVLHASRAFLRANPASLARLLRRAGGVFALGGAAFLLIRGAFSVAFPLAMFGWWLLLGAPGVAGGGGQKTPGQTSRVVTEHLEVELDHDTGEMTGRVLKGFFAGRRLERLKPAELAHLWQDCRFSDPNSARLIETFLDREHPTWREDVARGEAEMAGGKDGRMSEAEALEILGLRPGATAEDVRQAHRALMLKLHPDRGGSTYLAAKVNEAKDVLLGQRD